ncbi:ATP-binding protein [Pelagicoccus mobilis]|uniref:histidine kinase n=1 Tax=Pelagicoccus mobilis TaxID=415221 RepID=A0A934VP57_9BACT|nr:ATP-binding protein [Pelagicoccus mobilis]MBK1876937.1 response regulator [Pelagicoccus mobilis]
MLPESLESPLDRMYDHWARIGLNGRVCSCSDQLRRRVLAAGEDLGSLQARELFGLGEQEGELFYAAWVAALRGKASVLSLSLATRQAEKASVSLMPQFDEEGLVAGVVLGIECEGGRMAVGLRQPLEYSERGEDALRELSQLREDLAMARERMQALEAESGAKSEFLASVSHEIRTPLNAVLGFCDLLGKTALDEKQEEFVTAMSKSGRHLIELIGQTLEFSRIESGNLDLEKKPLRLDSVLAEAQAMLGDKALENSIAFSVDLSGLADEIVLGDATRLKQILVNLLGNAFKFTGEGSVNLRAETKDSSKEGFACLRVSVEDTGKGIDPDQAADLFEPFVQSELGVGSEFCGSGLGLAICKRLCEAMDGDVWLESTVLGKGSVFAFEIQLEREGGKTAVSEEQTGEESKMEVDERRVPAEETARVKRTGTGPIRLLVVDDNPNNLLITSKLSQHLGYQAETVSNGIDALERMKDGGYDIVLMDVRMAPINGIETTRKIRDGEAGERSSEAYIIAVTAHALQGDKEKCLASGMNDYLSKPLTLDRLQDSLNRARSELSLD